MSYRSLAEFLETLAQADQLVRVEVPVDPHLEAAAITDRVAKAAGPAVLFSSLTGQSLPVVTNLLGTEGRIVRALGVVSLDDARLRLEELLRWGEPEGWLDRLKGSPQSALLRKLPPRTVRTGACQQVIRLGTDVDLNRLPLLRAWSEEGDRSLTAGQLYTRDPDTGRRFVGHTVFQQHDAQHLAAFWGPHDELLRLLSTAGQRGETLPIAIVLGGDPASLLAAAAPLPRSADAAELAGLLRDKPLDVVRCRTSELEVPADAELVLEGSIDPGEPPVAAGPLCTPSGLCLPSAPCPVVQVTAVTHRANAVMPAMVFGQPPHEYVTLLRAMQRVFLPLVRLAVPDLADCDQPPCGAARQWTFVAIRKHYAGQAVRVAHALWGLESTMFSKFLVLVDEEVDVHNSAAVLQAMAQYADPGRDLVVAPGPPDRLDLSAWGEPVAHRLAIDATRKLPGERSPASGVPVALARELAQRVAARWPEYGLRDAIPGM